MPRTSIRQTLAAAGRVGHDLLAVDWSRTPLGPPESWSDSLCHEVGQLLSSRFPMWLAWGEDLTFICNEGFRRQTLGRKYPWALGRPAREVWAEIWSDLEPRFEQVLTTGEPTWDEALQMFVERSGYVEETYFTFSCSPLTDDDGTIAGVLLVIAEDTDHVVNSRRMDTLRHLGIRVSTAESELSAVQAACAHLALNDESVPWAVAYLFDERQDAVLAGTAGIDPGHPAAPTRLRRGAHAVWPVEPLLRGEEVVVDELDRRFPDLPTGAWSVPPREALLVPLRDPLHEQPYGFLVVSANRFRPVDGTFADFADLIAGHFAAAITDARAVEEQRQHSESLLDQAERLARLGSWEIDLDDDRITGSSTFLELIERTPEQLEHLGARAVSERFLRAVEGDVGIPRLESATPGRQVEYETTLMLPSGHQRTLHVRGEVVEMGAQGPRLLRGSAQDVTEQRLLQDRIVSAEAERRSSEREREIADELQRSLLPEVPASTCAIDVATYYRPGLAGTQVGGDWYDVIDLGGGRTALVIGDVMGHGVRAAAVMGQVKSAVRAFARLDLPPAELAEHMDGLVQDLPGDEIVTWVYAVYDPAEACVSYANAGHLPPLLVDPTGDVTELGVTRPPLGAGFYGSDEASTAELRTGSLLALYTDGLAERRGSDLADGLDSLTARLVAQRDTDLSELPGLLVDQMLEELGEGTDDLALALVRVQDPERQVARHDLPADPGVVGVARDAVAGHLGAWGVARSIVDDLVLVTSELVTNAVLHGSPPIELRLQRTQREIVVEVKDDSVAPPRRRRAGADDEGGRGLSIVEAMTDRWGSRSVADGKVVWATMSLGADRGGPA